MIMSQRYPTYFDGIVSGDPAIRTGNSNLGLAYFAAAMNGVNPKLSDADKKLVVDAIVNSCDEKDGLKDGMIFNTKAPEQMNLHWDCFGPGLIVVWRELFPARNARLRRLPS